MPRTVTGNSYVADPQCAHYIHPEFTLLCLDNWQESTIALKRFVIADYFWADRVAARLPNGEIREVQNPEPQLRNAAGKPIHGMTYLRQLDGKIIASLYDDPVYVTDRMYYAASPDENYLYAPCKTKTKSRFDGDYERVCRYRLDGLPHVWEEVFSFELIDRLKSGIQRISLDAAGNVYFNLPGVSGKYGGIWKFNAANKQIEQVVPGVQGGYEHRPMISPDGKKIAFERNYTLYIATYKGE